MPLVEVFNDGVLYKLERSDRHESSYFGGPSETLIDGMPRRSPPLHHVVTLLNHEVGIGGYEFGFKTEFLYGLRFEGCALTYQRTANNAAKVTALNPPRPADAYPYAGFPDLLPYVPLRISNKTECSAEEFSEQIYNTGWTCRPGCVYVVVPDPPNIGFTLWGPSGNYTEIVFEYDPEKGIVRACNQCS